MKLSFKNKPINQTLAQSERVIAQVYNTHAQWHLLFRKNYKGVKIYIFKENILSIIYALFRHSNRDDFL